MRQNKLFYFTRARLAFWYAGIMGVILSLCGIGVYQGIAHAHWVALNQELKSVAGTLHDSIETTLQVPGRLEPGVQQFLPDICLAGARCIKEQPLSYHHILGVINQGNYYIRLYDNSGHLIAVSRSYPPGLSQVLKNQLWQTLQDSQGNRYQQVSLVLHTQNNRNWGYLQLGRSLKDFDNYLANLLWILGLGLPIAMGLVGVSSWWLAGLVIQPIYKSYQQIQQFTADAAHELRTPLAATQATVESTLRMPELSDLEARDALEHIKHQNRRLIQLVTDLLLLARLDRQAAAVQRQKICLNDIVNDLVEELEVLAIDSGVTLNSEIRLNQTLLVRGDEGQLYRLISNLIVNGIQYNPAGGKVCVILDRIDEQAVIQVQDTGIGIAAEHLTHLFDRFYRVNSSRSRHTGGSGLGLAIAHTIVQTHNGSLQIQSELGKGSTFTVRLPLSVTSEKES